MTVGSAMRQQTSDWSKDSVDMRMGCSDNAKSIEMRVKKGECND